jgi:probable addiction module antidote protein
MRIDYGPGYRVYFVKRGALLVILLAGAHVVGDIMAKKLSTRPYDAAAYLKTEQDCALYMQAAIDESDGDPALVIAALGDIARARGMMQLARETGLTREGLYKALSPEGNPSFATVMKVCKALGLKLHTEAVEA